MEAAKSCDPECEKMANEVTSDFVLDWDILRGNQMVRRPYSVADVNNFPLSYPVLPCDVKLDILNYAYNKGVMCRVNRCQEYYYFGIDNYGSVVCEKCLPAARYALFSVHDRAYVNKLHVHVNMLVQCLHCNHRISSVAIGKCKISDCDYIESKLMYQCVRMNK